MGKQNAILGLVLLLFSSCSSLLYYPTRSLHYDPSKLKLKPEEVFFPSKNGSKLFGWYFSAAKKPAKGVILLFHGNAENLSSHYLSAVWLLNHGYDLFVFSYQGYGRSEGSPKPKNTVEDGVAALNWVAQKRLPVIVLGQSLGGAIAMRSIVELENRSFVKFVALDSTFPSYKSMGRKVLSRSILTWPFQWLGWLVMSDEYAPEGRIGEISPIPLLVIHGENDSVVEMEMGERIFQEAKEPKEFWKIPHGGHTDIFMVQPEKYKQEFLDRLDRALK
jgi:fermentation-respiration switch protein FrsA (DUF1100 family)